MTRSHRTRRQRAAPLEVPQQGPARGRRRAGRSRRRRAVRGRLRGLHRVVRAAAGLAQATRPGRLLRWSCDRNGRKLGVIQARRPAQGDPVHEHPAEPQGRDDRDRGRALLRAQGRRLPGRHPRRRQEPRVRQAGAGRLDDDDAARPHAVRLDGEDATSARSARPSSPRSSRTSTPRTGSSPSTSTPSRTAPTAARPRSACGRRPRRTSTSRRRELTLRQAALLAGLPQAPTLYSPVRSPAAAKIRRNEVLERDGPAGHHHGGPGRGGQGVAAGPRHVQVLPEAPRGLLLRLRQGRALQDLPGRVVRRGGLRVHTTIDLDKQEAARDAIAAASPASARRRRS